MRLFVAVEIEPQVINATLALIRRLQTRAARVAPLARITWLTADRLHVTVRFIGHVDDEKAEDIRRTLGQPPDIAPFDLTVAGVGTFPPKGSARVVRAGLTGGCVRLLAVEGVISERLARVGIAPEARPYSPHLTLGRIREAAGLRAAALLDGVRETVLGTTRVDAITLFESRLSPKGPTYVALQRTALVHVPREGGDTEQT
jgi:2'-5' RNA ligase